MISELLIDTTSAPAVIPTRPASDLDADLLEQVHCDVGTPVGLVVAFLLAASEGVHHGHLVDLLFEQRLFDGVELRRLNVCCDQFHDNFSFVIQ